MVSGSCAPGYREAPVDQEERNAGDADLDGPRLIGAHVVGVGVAGQHGRDLVGREPGRHGERRQFLGQADRDTFFEVTGEEPLLHRVLDATLPGEVQEPVGIERPAGPGLLQVIVETFRGGEIGDALVLRGGLLNGDAVLAGDPFRVRPVADRWRARIELVAAPNHLDRMAERRHCASRTGACRCSTTGTRRRTRSRPAQIPPTAWEREIIPREGEHPASARRLSGRGCSCDRFRRRRRAE